MVQVVVVGPKHLERGHGEDHQARRQKKVEGVPERSFWVLEVLQYIKHQDEGVLLSGPEADVKRANLYAVAMGIPGIDQFRARLYAFDLPKFRQAVKKKSVPAAYVQNPLPVRGA
jgi:hypothetical protein